MGLAPQNPGHNWWCGKTAQERARRSIADVQPCTNASKGLPSSHPTRSAQGRVGLTCPAAAIHFLRLPVGLCKGAPAGLLPISPCARGARHCWWAAVFLTVRDRSYCARVSGVTGGCMRPGFCAAELQPSNHAPTPTSRQTRHHERTTWCTHLVTLPGTPRHRAPTLAEWARGRQDGDVKGALEALE